MNREQEAVLKLLGSFISKTDAAPAADADWKKILEISAAHQVTGILYYKAKSSLPAEFLPDFQRSYLACVADGTKKNAVLKAIDKAFTENGIPYLIFKGTEIAARYPVPALRTMGDLDILVHEEDKERAGDLLLSIGFTGDDRRDMEWCFFKNGMEFELHHRLLYDETVNSEADKAFGDAAWENASPAACDGSTARYVLDVSYHYVYILLHLKKHILNNGAGLRQFADAAVWKKYAGTDPEKVAELLKEADIERFAAVCGELCARWFDGIENKEVFSDAFYEQTTQTIFDNGVFGFQNEENAEKHMLNQVRTKGTFLTILSRIFPSYRDFYYVPHYSFIQGRPYLLPVAWIYRFYRAIRYGKLKESEQYVSDVIGSGEKAKERENVLKEWGI
ncbi:MAG: nucleotidyltransferase family protein [Lachnospiraceae bacterium]|nr:nucleotidyltransferase family protein [Lachnospiraceae bacterium]